MSDTTDAASLFGAAQGAGEIRPSTARLINPLARRVNQRLTPVPKKNTFRRKIFVGQLLDNTLSMMEKADDPKLGRKVPNMFTAGQGHDLVWEALGKFAHAASLECLTDFVFPNPAYIQGDIQADHYKWVPVGGAPRLCAGFDSGGKRVTFDEWAAGNFVQPLVPLCNGSQTPLYRSATEFLAALLAQCQAWEDAHSVQTFSSSLILSDGDNNADEDWEDKCNALVTDLLQTEKHKVFLMGLRTGNVDFFEVGRRMGIPQHCVRVVERDPKAIRAMFELFSQTTEEASQVAASGGKVSDIAFGGPSAK